MSRHCGHYHLREQEQGRRERKGVITDAIAETEWWAAFKKPGVASAKPKQGSLSTASTSSPPLPPKVHKKPWRNAPCPCGSGKKYKHRDFKPGDEVKATVLRNGERVELKLPMQ